MAIVYDWYENPNAEGESEERGLFFPHFGGHTESDPQDQEQAFETTLERC